MIDEQDGAAEAPPVEPCFATLWQHHRWWYVIEQHDCGMGHGWWLIGHHRDRVGALEAAEARYPKPHPRG